MDGRRLYDWWSRNLWALRGMYGLVFLGRERTFRRRSIAALDLDSGDSVLELGCGPGNSFAPLRDAVGPDGLVVGVDYSHGMVERASDRIADADWENVHAVQADATEPGLVPDSFDAAYAAMSMSAMPDPRAVVEAAAACLRPDGRLAVLDARPFQRLPLSVLNPLVVPVFARLTDWDHETDIPAAVDGAFETHALRDYHGGSIYVATGSRPQANSGPAATD